MHGMIEYDDFLKVEIRVGKIVDVQQFPKAKKPAYRLKIDFGAYGVKQSSAQITNYSKKELLGRLIVAVTNFSPKNIAGFQSEVLVLGTYLESGVVELIAPSENAKLGSLVR